jgi:glucose/arabinose dehydrogenase
MRPFGNTLGLLLAMASASALAQTAPSDLTLVTVANVTSPVAIRAPADGSGRIFIVGQNGAIRIVKNGTLLPTPFLTVPVTFSGESGLLGLAFHPNFGKPALPHNNEFYVAFNRPSSDPKLGSSPDVVSPATGFRQPGHCQHHGNPGPARSRHRLEPQWRRHPFRPGWLSVHVHRRGGVQGDPNGFAMCLWKKAADNTPGNCGSGTPTYFLMGKVLRLDVDNPAATVSADMCGSNGINPPQYSIPADNPHVGTSNTCDEIWLHGFRNPWRTSFDRVTGDFWIGDVGQGSREEIDFRARTSTEPTFYGWRCLEGSATYNSQNICAVPPANVLPVMEYTHANGRCAITGGFRFRGPIAALNGMYIFAEACTSEIYFGKPAAGNTWTYTTWRDDANGYGTYSGFGEDEFGNLYVANNQDGVVSKFVSDHIFDNGFDN